MPAFVESLHLDPVLFGLTAILVLGVGAQLIAAKLRLPSILLLLVVGFIAGPATGLLDPDSLLGDLLFPFVSLSVAIILYEGGLTLHLAELPRAGGVMSRLISVGALVTWIVGGLSAYWIAGLSIPMAVLLGAILIVTGPTVISPLLRQVRPEGVVGTVLKWEGILIDPVGAVLAVLVFEAIIVGEFGQAPERILVGVLQTLAVGAVIGGVAAIVLVGLLRRYLIPDHLQNAFSLLVVLASFTLSNTLVAESGLLTVTLLGLALANQRQVAIRHIIEFKENLQVLLIGSLFILLAARLEPRELLDLGWRAPAFLAALVLVARPLAVMASTFGSRLDWRERVFLMCMAPRGIVAAAVASIFAFELAAEKELAYPGSELLVPLTFVVIVGTVTIYGLLAGPVARRLGLAQSNPQGVLIVGALAPGTALAQAIAEHGFRALVVDSNFGRVAQARMAGLDAHLGNAADEQMVEELDLAGIGRLVAMTPNDEANALAARHFSDEFGRAEVYRLPPSRDVGGGDADRPRRGSAGGRLLLSSEHTYRQWSTALAEGARIRATSITDRFDRGDYRATHGESAMPLFVVTAEGELQFFTTNEQPVVRAGDTLVSLMHDTEKDEPVAPATA
jgi:NhaP-type Na+/H+ or K+/H+ antiporter